MNPELRDRIYATSRAMNVPAASSDPSKCLAKWRSQLGSTRSQSALLQTEQDKRLSARKSGRSTE